MIVIGLGSGRCGTTSLQTLVNNQNGAVCFHEMNHACMAWGGAEATVLSTLADFRAALDGGPRAAAISRIGSEFARHRPVLDRYGALSAIRLIGDVAFYYLPYVEMIAEHCDDVRFPCLWRDRQETIDSLIAKTTDSVPRGPGRWPRLVKRRFRPHDRNHWMDHDGRRWWIDPIWHGLFPKFNDARDKADAIGRYWDAYYAEAARLERSGKVRIFDMNDLNSEEGQRAILAYCGIERPTLLARVQENAGKQAAA